MIIRLEVAVFRLVFLRFEVSGRDLRLSDLSVYCYGYAKVDIYWELSFYGGFVDMDLEDVYVVGMVA